MNTAPGGKIGNFPVKSLPLLTPTVFGSGQFGLCGLRGRPIVTFRYLKVV